MKSKRQLRAAENARGIPENREGTLLRMYKETTKTVAEIAAEFQVNERTVYRYIKKAGLSNYRFERAKKHG